VIHDRRVIMFLNPGTPNPRVGRYGPNSVGIL
jgi:hypothetical protein